MKSFALSILLLSSTLFANETIEQLYEKALKYEEEKDYKNAMLIYKQIANKENTVKKIFVDEDKEKEITEVSKLIDTIEDKETEQTILQMLASSFNLYPYNENYFLPFSYVSNVKDGRKKLKQSFK